MNLTNAQQLILRIFGHNPKPPRDHKAPHAYRPTPPKPRYSRQGKRRLFKGRRP